MAINKRIRFIRGTETQSNAFTGYSGEITVDTTTWTLRVHDGVTAGGHAVASSSVVFSGDYDDLTNKPILFSGAYADLTGKPALFSGSYTDLTNKPTLFDGAYSSLTGTPTIPADVSDLTDTTNLLDHFSGDYNDLTNKPVLFSGAYADLTGKPTIPADVSELTDTTNLLVHFSGAYADLTGKPTIPADVSELTDTTNLLDHFSGAYADLTGKPTIPTLGNFSLSNNTITASSGASPVVLSIFGADSADPPALISREWSFGTDGSLTLPGSIDAPGAVILKAYYGPPGTYRQWSFDGAAGNITFPDSTVQTTAWTGNVAYGNVTGTPTLSTVATTGSYDDLSDKPTIPTVPTTVSSFTNDANYVASNTTGITGADQVTNMVTLTQAEYDAITPNASTVYFIVG